MNFKKLVMALFVAITTMSVCVYAKTMEFTMGDRIVRTESGGVIDEKTIEVAPYTINDRTVVPVRVFFETFGADVSWDEATVTATITVGNKVIKLTVNDTTAYVNGEKAELDVAPVQINDRMLVPIRFISETLDYKVSYVDATEQVMITDDPIVMTIGNHDVYLSTYKMLYNIYTGSFAASEQEIVEYTDKYIKDIYLFYSDGIESGFSFTAEDYASIKSTIDANYDEDTKSTILRSVLTDFYTKSFFAENISNYIYAISTSDISGLPEYYENNFYKAKHILILNESEDAEKTIKSIKYKLDRGGNFDKLMEEYSEDPGLIQNPDGYVFTDGEMVEEFEEATKKLKAGQVSGIVKTDYGYHIIKREKLPEYDDTMSEACIYAMGYKGVNDYKNTVEERTPVTKHISDEELIDLLVN